NSVFATRRDRSRRGSRLSDILAVHLENLRFSLCASAFQPFSVGLGCRVIPALGGFARQFQPWRVSVSLSDCRLLLLQKRKQSAPDPPKNWLRSPGERPLRSGSPQLIRGTKGRQHTCFAKIASLSSDFL